jgi:glycosyltransferase involved in cell wall biosynthesis
MNSELVSIVMATYNGEQFLRQQLDSILGQTYRHFELIAVDDASTDSTLGILNEYAASDERIHVYPAEKNLGLITNFERGLKLAKGEYIALSDQDDIFRKDKIELLVKALTKKPNHDLALSDLSLVDENDVEVAPSMWRYQKLKPQQGKPFRRLLYLNFATGCAIMFRRRLLQVALPFPSACLVHDWWLAVVASSSHGGGIELVAEQLTAYRQHGFNQLGAIVAKTRATKLCAALQWNENSSGGISIAEQSMNEMQTSIARMDGYLQKKFWAPDERRAIKEIRDTLDGYRNDANSGLLRRMGKLPRRLKVAALSRSATHCAKAALLTLAPGKKKCPI